MFPLLYTYMYLVPSARCPGTPTQAKWPGKSKTLLQPAGIRADSCRGIFASHHLGSCRGTCHVIA